MLASEMISVMTEMMERVGNFDVKITEDGRTAQHVTSVAHTQSGEDHAIVLASVTPQEVEDAVAVLEQGANVAALVDPAIQPEVVAAEAVVAVIEKVVEEAVARQNSEVDPAKATETPAEIPHETVTDDAEGGV